MIDKEKLKNLENTVIEMKQNVSKFRDYELFLKDKIDQQKKEIMSR